jgi:high affinity Mn2+ porin
VRCPWGRPDDVWGIGAAMNGLSRPHREYLAIGGTGLLIGDGRLSYAPERIFETYYAFKPTKFVTVSLDYQFVANPAYNRDRGPASFAALRLHAEF